jgi:hypothetical protein
VDEATKPHYIDCLLGNRETDPTLEKRLSRKVKIKIDKLYSNNRFSEGYVI